MIDLDKIEEWNENDHGDEAYEIQAIVSKGDLLDIITSLRQAEKDAARYRWLRDTGCFEGSADDLFHATPAETDAEFDRFMQCNGDNK